MKHSRGATLAALGAIALWGNLAWLSVELAAVPPFLVLACALAIGALPALVRVRQWRVPLRTLALGVYGLFAYHFCLFLALRLAPPVEANLVNYLWPLLIVFLAPILLEHCALRFLHVLGVMLGFAGAALAATTNFGTHDFAVGYVFALAAAFIWATYSLWTKRVAPFPTAAVGLFCAVAACLAFVLHVSIEPPSGMPAAALPYLVALGLGPLGASFFLWDYALKHGDPRIIGTLAYLTPVLSTGLLIATGHGVMSPRVALAALLVVSGAAVAGRARNT